MNRKQKQEQEQVQEQEFGQQVNVGRGHGHAQGRGDEHGSGSGDGHRHEHEHENEHIQGQGQQNGDRQPLQATACHSNDAGDGEERRSHHSAKLKSNLASRLNRIEGQIRGIKGMIEKDTYCDDVLNQIAAVQSALNGVGKLLLEAHMRSCIVDRIESGDHEVLDELMVTINKLMK